MVFRILLLLGCINAQTFLVINGNSYHHNVTEYDYCDNDCNSNNWGIGYEKHIPKTGVIGPYQIVSFIYEVRQMPWRKAASGSRGVVRGGGKG